MTSILPTPDSPANNKSASPAEASAEKKLVKTDEKLQETPAPTAAPGERALHPAPLEGGSGGQMKALLHYLLQTDVHTYAFSVAANVILSLVPFIVLLLTLSRRVFHSPTMTIMVGDMMKNFLPNNQDYIMRNMNLLAHPQKSAQFFSIFMLLFSSTGVFLPLEVALNNVWHVEKNRSYLHNQIVSLGLSLCVGILAMASVAFSTGQQTLLAWLFFAHTQNAVYSIVSHYFLKILAILSGILLFFLIYWILPNRKIPPMAVLPTAFVIGILWELAKQLYIHLLPWLDFERVYGPFSVSVGLMMWAFLSGLLLLAGAHFSATRHALRMARQADKAN